MSPLFVSFVGNLNGQHAQGWVVLSDQPKLVTGQDIAEMAVKIEDLRRYDPGTLVIISFRRLEPNDAGQ